MPRTTNTVVENNFINGLVTEATALNFPENACTSTDNCVFHQKGDVFRRYGLDYEPGHTTHGHIRSERAISTFLWQNPAGVADLLFEVVQVGTTLHFYLVRDQALSTGMLSGIIEFSGFATTSFDRLPGEECQFAYGQGYLFVTHPFCDPFYVEYIEGSESFTAAPIYIKIRDTDGVEDELGYEWDTRPTWLSDQHKYNLYNQGWAPTTTADYINTWRKTGANQLTGTLGTGRTDYPSNADVWWLFKNSSDIMDLANVDRNSRGKTPAPKGHYVLNAFYQDRATASGIAGLPPVSSNGHRPSCVAFFSGRVVYAGVDHAGFNNNLYISQTVRNKGNFDKCHQLNDPTNEYLFNLLETDGGVISILDCGKIVKLYSLGTTLLIFTTNGIWSLSGNQGIGFTASDFSIRKVSSIPAISHTSFIDVDGMPVWWNNDGIYMVTGANAVGAVQIEPLTEKTIRTFYNDIPVNNKKYARGGYSPLTRQVIWLFKSQDEENITTRYEFDRALVFNTVTKAFYPWTFADTPEKVVGLAAIKTRGTIEGESSLMATVFKYLIANGDDFSFAETYDTTYEDFGVSYDSYFITGYKVSGGKVSLTGANRQLANRKFQNNYVTIYCRTHGEPEFFIQGISNFGNSVNSGYFGSKQRLAFPNGLTDYQKRRVKIRGSGNCLQLKVTSVPNKPFDISGWAAFETTNASI